VLGRQINSPLDLERTFGLIGGDIFHGALNLDQIFSARPMLGMATIAARLPAYICVVGNASGGWRDRRAGDTTRRARSL
jgi:phytoene dehydrogenase-like protein